MAKRWGSRVPAIVATAVIAEALVLVPSVASASGGGGCGGPVTDGEGAAVDIAGNCFSPTILRAAPGDVVTFANADPVPHTVLGANGAWGGYDMLKAGREATYSFTEPGVYPYVCTVHPGMVGTIVVGDGAGGEIDSTTAAGPVVPGTSVSTLGAAPVESVRVALDAGWWPLFGLGVMAAALGALAALGAMAIVRRGVGSLDA
jgi:plastocyanin